MFTGGLLGGLASAAIVMPSANAAPPNTCSASGLANTISTVSASTTSYLETHPQTNQAFTDIAKQSPTQAQESYRAYFANNPQTANDMRAIQKPVQDLSAECGLTVSPTPVVDALQAL
jgi:hemophore-related protein